MVIVRCRDHPRGRCGLPNLIHFSLLEVVLHSIYKKNIPKDYHFSIKLLEMS